jgi:hypothetical protein
VSGPYLLPLRRASSVALAFSVLFAVGLVLPSDTLAGQLASSIGALGAWIATSTWLTRARTNAQRIDPRRTHRRRRGWAWWGWVVPVVSLWFPYQVVRDVDAAAGDYPSRLLGWWWASWLALLVVSGIDDRLAAGVEPAGPDTLTVLVRLLSWALTIAGLLLWHRVLTRIDRIAG